MNLDDLLHGVPDERALPGALRDRLEELLRTRAWTGVADDNPLEGIDEPRPFPEPARERIETAMHARATDLLEGLDEPIEMPAALRARVERALIPPTPARQPVLVRALAVAAGAMLLATSLSIALRDDRGTPLAGPSAPGTPPAEAPAAQGDPGEATTVDEIVDGGSAIAEPGLVSGPGFAPRAAGEPPPFAYVGPYPAPAYPQDAGPGTATDGGTTPSVSTPLVVAVRRGDPWLEAGFDAYIGLLNRSGGIRGRPVTLVDAAEGDPRALVTVNLSDTVLDPGGLRGPILESPVATTASLRGRVRGFSSPPERQARALAVAIQPGPAAPGTTAVIYHGARAPFDDAVPDALEEELRARGVAVARVAFEPGSSTNLFVQADHALLSLDGEATEAWLRQAQGIAYRPRATLAGIYPMFDAALLPLLDGQPVRIMSPYELALTAETRSGAFRRMGRSIGARTIHGWVTAKSLAVAAWLSEADDARAMAEALRGLEGFANGFAPAYETRPGTNARIPDGILYGVRDGRFYAVDGFTTHG